MSRGKQFMIGKAVWFCAFVYLLMIGCSSQSTPLKPAVASQFAQLYDWRSRAEGWAEKLKRDTSMLGTPEYHQAEALYIDAKAEADAWIDSFRLNFAAVREEDNKYAIERVAAKSSEFVQYVRAMYVKGFAGREVGEFVTAIGMNIYKEYRAAGEKRKDEIKVELERARWRSFGDI